MDSRQVQIPRLPSKPRERPRRVKTYTGCWTCRRRRVKCDEGRPTCRRCEAGNFTCEGYDIKLTWTNQASTTTDTGSRPDSVASPSATYSQRSSVRANNPRHAPTVAAEDIPSILNDLDGIRSGRSLKSKGPFSVFSINPDVQLERSTPDYRLSIQNLVEPMVPSAPERLSSDPPPARHVSEPTFVQYDPTAPEDQPMFPDLEGEVDEGQSTTAHNPRRPRRARSSDYEEIQTLAHRED